MSYDFAKYSIPVYILNGKSYKTVNGFLNALLKDCGASSSTMVRADRTIECYNGPYGNRNTVAVYQVEAPCSGKPMRVSRVQS